METRIGSSMLRAAALAAGLAVVPFAAHAQYAAPPAWNHGASQLNYAATPYSQQQLERMLAPIALYPDNLLGQVLVAATRPDQVAQAAGWIQANPSLHGENAVVAAQSMGWDPSVAALTAFPQLLAQMAQDPAWTHDLGQAFYSDQGRVMDAVQELRRRAQDAGTLRSDDQLVFQQNGAWIGIESALPYATYLPYYDPLVAFGAWPWASYPPVYWRPWAGYRYRPGYRFAWGPSVRYSAPHRASRFDWTQRRFDFAGQRHSFQPRFGAQSSRRAEPPRAVAPRSQAPRFERRSEARPQAAPRNEAFRSRWQERRAQEGPRTSGARSAAPAQPREHGRGHRRGG